MEAKRGVRINPLNLPLPTSWTLLVVKCTLSYWPAALQHLLCIQSIFDGNGTLLQHRLMSLKRLCVVLLAPT